MALLRPSHGQYQMVHVSPDCVNGSVLFVGLARAIYIYGERVVF